MLDELLKQKKQVETELTEIYKFAGDKELNLQFENEKNTVLPKKSEAEAKLKNIQNEYEIISKKMTVSDGEQSILNAIKTQRFYFFKNKVKFVFDKTTALIWPNIEYYNLGKREDDTNYHENWNYDEALNYLKTFELDNIKSWRMPSFNEVRNLVKNRLFPFIHPTYHSIYKKKWNRGYNTLVNDGTNKCTVLGYPNWNEIKIGDTSSNALYPCSPSFVEKDYEQNVSETNNIYNADEKAKMTLNVFLKNNLIPLFDNNPELTDVFVKLYIEKPKLVEQLKELNKKISEAGPIKREFLKDLDYNNFIKDYNLNEINNSVIKYFQNIIKFEKSLLSEIDEYEIQNNNLLSSTFKVIDFINEKYSNDENFFEEENNLFNNRLDFFKKYFDFGLENLKNSLIAFKNEGELLEKELFGINYGNKARKFDDLEKFQNKKYPSFSFIAENSSEIVKDKILQLKWFEQNETTIFDVIKLHKETLENYKLFKDKTQKDYYKNCKNDSIEEENYLSWFKEWNKEIYLINLKLLPLIESFVIGLLPVEIVYELIKVIFDYKQNVDNFYLNERKNIHTKFAFVDNGNLQEKFEKESEFTKILNSFQEKLENIIFSNKSSQQKIFIIRWAKDWFDNSVNEILNFIELKNINSISKDIVSQFRMLKMKNLEAFLIDVKLYSDERKEREKEYNNLIFKMRKELKGK